MSYYRLVDQRFQFDCFFLSNGKKYKSFIVGSETVFFR